MNNAQRVNQTSGIFEYYTDKLWVDAAREVMGGIELDPASSLTANLIVMADRFYDEATNGLAQSWKAKSLWMNHPFHRGEKPCPTDRSKCAKKTCKTRGHHIDQAIPGNMDWINKLIDEYENGHVEQAICITFGSTSEAWFRKLLAYPQCFPNGRIQYYKPDGTLARGVTKGSVLTYLGPNVAMFDEVFSRYGTVK
ncbi:hypothetical protein [Vibrio sp. H11]|uniref:hypothetical protein n=1 Tax=Vibrio sp. H11 TaxID=2565928 RepID=UPI0010A60D8D|nr:hypothetical protein [Vibrio sp. H11]